jgi:hypothetical protein
VAELREAVRPLKHGEAVAVVVERLGQQQILLLEIE